MFRDGCKEIAKHSSVFKTQEALAFVSRKNNVNPFEPLSLENKHSVDEMYQIKAENMTD